MLMENNKTILKNNGESWQLEGGNWHAKDVENYEDAVMQYFIIKIEESRGAFKHLAFSNVPKCNVIVTPSKK